MLRPILALGTALLFAACGGDSGTSPLDDSGNGNGNGGTGANRVVKADPSFSTDIQEIFNRKGCATSGCHGSSEAAGLRLTAGDSYAALVNVASVQSGTLVIPGDAQNSYLVVKIEGRQSIGQRMPINGSPLDSIDVANLRNWIDQGAANN